jgi:4'-phosphopantetheinyl transferase
MHDLRPGTAQVWLIHSKVAPSALTELERTLDDAERRRADELVEPAHRRRFVVAHAAARRILSRYLDTAPERIRWQAGPDGMRQAQGLRVNLSHTTDLVALAVSCTRGVGVDIQWCAPNLPAGQLSERFYAWPEARFVAAGRTAADVISRFARLWARKEAVVKAAGGRISRGLRLSVAGPGTGLVVHGPHLPGPFRVRDMPAPQGFHAAVALAGTAGFRVAGRWWDVDTDDAGAPVRQVGADRISTFVNR